MIREVLSPHHALDGSRRSTMSTSHLSLSAVSLEMDFFSNIDTLDKNGAPVQAEPVCHSQPRRGRPSYLDDCLGFGLEQYWVSIQSSALT